MHPMLGTYGRATWGNTYVPLAFHARASCFTSHAPQLRPNQPKNLRSRTSTVYGFSGNVGRTLYSSPSGSVAVYCIVDCHLLGGISPNFVLSDEKERIDIRLGTIISAVSGLFGLAAVARGGRVRGSERGSFLEGAGEAPLRSLPASASCPLRLGLSSLAAAGGLLRESSFRASFLDSEVKVKRPLSDDGLGLWREDDAFEGILAVLVVDEEAIEDREGDFRRRERLSIVLIASCLDAFERDMRDA